MLLEETDYNIELLRHSEERERERERRGGGGTRINLQGTTGTLNGHIRKRFLPLFAAETVLVPSFFSPSAPPHPLWGGGGGGGGIDVLGLNGA